MGVQERFGGRAGEPSVKGLRQILIWPLGLVTPQADAPTAASDKIARALGGDARDDNAFMEKAVQQVAQAVENDPGCWKRVPDGLDHITRPESAVEAAPFRYAEFVYFHDFVSNFLYAPKIRAPGESAPPAFYLFANEKLTDLAVDITVWSGWEETRTFRKLRFRGKVERANLYLFRTGVALVAVEAVFEKAPQTLTEARAGADDKPAAGDVAESAEPTALSLDDVLLLSDRLRRAYVPAFAYEKIAGEDPWVAFGAPDEVIWGTIADDHAPTAPRLAETLGRSVGAKERAAPLLPHWSALLPKAIAVEGDGVERKERPAGGTFRHLLDERMPIMSYVNLDPGKLRAPLGRISPGQFMRLAFVDPPGTDEFPYSRSFMSEQEFVARHCYDRFVDDGTRYLVTSNSFVVIGSGKFFEDTLVHHFRRMYFQMVMLTQFEFASLIAFSARVSRAMERADRAGRRLDFPAFRDDMMRIHEDFVAFVHRFRFTGISNQIQAQELHALVRGSIGLDRLFEEVKTEIEMGASHLHANEAAAQTNAATRLNAILGVGAVLGLAFAFPDAWNARMLAEASGAVLASLMVLMLWWRSRSLGHQPVGRSLERILLFVAVVAAVLFVIEWQWSWLQPAPPAPCAATPCAAASP